MSYHVLIAKHFPIQIVHRNFVKIVIECPIVISEYFISLFSNLIWTFFSPFKRHCQKLHASDHKYACAFRSSDNYETIGLPFIISLPESKLTCANVFEQIRIYAK
jgi:hypothetical protein